MVFNVRGVLWVQNDYFFILYCIYFEKKTVQFVHLKKKKKKNFHK